MPLDNIMDREYALKKSGEICSEFNKEMDKIQEILRELDVSFNQLQAIRLKYKELINSNETNPPEY